MSIWLKNKAIVPNTFYLWVKQSNMICIGLGFNNLAVMIKDTFRVLFPSLWIVLTYQCIRSMCLCFIIIQIQVALPSICLYDSASFELNRITDSI